MNDGYCDDENNIAKCNYDGGDCCGEYINREYCDDCICFPYETCDLPLSMIGDGHCHDETNTVECNFDGGDCCGPCANTDGCSSCLCHAGSPIDPLCRFKFIQKFVNDYIFEWNTERLIDLIK